MESKRRRQQIYDHRLVIVVQQTGDSTIAMRLGVPRSTVAGWLARAPRPVTTVAVADDALAELRARVARLEKRNELLWSLGVRNASCKTNPRWRMLHEVFLT